jgi:hypothetical protein
VARKRAESGRIRDRKWLAWLINTIGPLGRPPPVRYITISKDPPRIKDEPRVWPLRSPRHVERFRDPLAEFARDNAPEIVRHQAWRPSLSTTHRVLARLWAILEWGRTNGRNRGGHFCFGGANLWIRTDRSGSQDIVVDYDDTFTLLYAFTVLVRRYIHLFRICSSPACGKLFVAARRPVKGRAPFCSTRCSGRNRQQRRRTRPRETRGSGV